MAKKKAAKKKAKKKPKKKPKKKGPGGFGEFFRSASERAR